MHRNRVLAPLLGGLLLLGSTGGVAADEPTVVSILGCSQQEGALEVPAGDVMLRSGWGAKTRGLVTANLRGITSSLTVNGEQTDLADFWSAPYPNDAGGWRADWFYPVGSLAIGDVLEVSYDLTFLHHIFDGWTHVDPGSATFDCTVTAVAP